MTAQIASSEEVGFWKEARPKNRFAGDRLRD